MTDTTTAGASEHDAPAHNTTSTIGRTVQGEPTIQVNMDAPIPYVGTSDDFVVNIRAQGEPTDAQAWEAEHPDVAALREARAETWDEAVAAVFAWWSAPEGERPALIVNPYGVGVPVDGNGEE